MPHIPEDELHSYLDQALSRSQCVEIERHLAHCGRCQHARDGIAALRDRTTLLVSALTPPRHRIPPSAEALRRQAEERGRPGSSRRRAGLWAASIIAALGLAWGAQALTRRAPAAQPGLAQASQAPVAPAAQHAAAPLRSAAPASADSATRSRDRARSLSDHRAIAISDREITPDDTLPDALPIEPVGTRLSAGRLPPSDFELAGEGMWRTLSWDNAQRERGTPVPRISGLPVVEVQVGNAHDSSGKPTMIVAQQLRSGELIRTIEGPATDVTRLLASQRAEARSSPWPSIRDSSGGSDGTMAMQRGDRMLAIQASPSMPSDSLRAMIRRLNAADR